MNPIGVGFLDLNPEGLFHLERMRLRTDFRCLSAWSHKQAMASPPGFIQRFVKTAEELIHDPQIELLWMSSQVDSASVRRALELGKSVLMGLPTGISPSEFQSWISSREKGSVAHPFVAAMHRWDGQFRTVQNVVHGKALGEIVDVRRISRQYVPGELSVPAVVTGASVDSKTNTLRLSQCDARVRQIKWFEMLDELLLLVRDPVATVTAVSSGCSRIAKTNVPTGRCVSIEFMSGCYAALELNRHSLAPLETGWVLDGTEAGFTAGKRFQAGADYELIDVPVEEATTDQDAFYDSLAASVRGCEEFPVTCESIRQVLTLLEMIELSLRTGQTVRVD